MPWDFHVGLGPCERSAAHRLPRMARRIGHAGGQLITKPEHCCGSQRAWKGADTVPGFMYVFDTMPMARILKGAPNTGKVGPLRHEFPVKLRAGSGSEEDI